MSNYGPTLIFRTKAKLTDPCHLKNNNATMDTKAFTFPSSTKPETSIRTNSQYMSSNLKPKPDPCNPKSQSEMPSYKEAAFGASSSTAGKYVSGSKTSSSSSKSTNGSSSPRMQDITRTVEKGPLKRVSSNEEASSRKSKR
jgi:hypothetical protein